MSHAAEALIEKLENEYCPPLDPPLFRALVSDFNLIDKEQLIEARAILDSIKSSAEAEEATGFDPSGSSGAPGEGISPCKDDARTDSKLSHDDTDLTSLSNGFSSTSLSDWPGSNNANIGSMENLDMAAKEKVLRDMFPTEKTSSIAFILKKADGSISKATDVLLNHIYFQGDLDGEDVVQTKGVDAFFEGNNLPSKRKKGKGKKKGAALDSSSASESSLPSSPVAVASPNKWQHASQDVQFIASRTSIPHATISSLYHKSGASIPATIAALIKQNSPADPFSVPPARVASAVELQGDFPSLTLTQATALVMLAQPSTANAHQLASSLTRPASPPSTSTRTGGIQVIPQYAPINISTEADHSPTLERASPVHKIHDNSPAQLSVNRSRAYAQASSAYRRGKSDPLFGGAAAYYADVARANHLALQELTAIDADRLVATQSGKDWCDLHGVSVKDGVRIANERVALWWDSLGEGRIEGSGWKVGTGYKIVVGVGRHSAQGKARLGPAVARSLIAEGWRVEIASGEVFVKGVMKR